MKDANWPYLAGLIDGEGCITITIGCRYWTNKDGIKTKYPAYCLQVTITNNSLKLMQYLIQHFGGVYYSHARKNPNANLGYIWMPKGMKNKETLLLSVLPYLVIKKEQANLALQFVRMKDQIDPPARQKLTEQIQLLNRRGISPTTNTLDSSLSELKIESELIGDYESAPAVTQAPKLIPLEEYKESLNKFIKKACEFTYDPALA